MSDPWPDPDPPVATEFLNSWHSPAWHWYREKPGAWCSSSLVTVSPTLMYLLSSPYPSSWQFIYTNLFSSFSLIRILHTRRLFCQPKFIEKVFVISLTLHVCSTFLLLYYLYSIIPNINIFFCFSWLYLSTFLLSLNLQQNWRSFGL